MDWLYVVFSDPSDIDLMALCCEPRCEIRPIYFIFTLVEDENSSLFCRFSGFSVLTVGFSKLIKQFSRCSGPGLAFD